MNELWLTIYQFSKQCQWIYVAISIALIYLLTKVLRAFLLLSQVKVPVVWWYPKFWKQDATKQRGQSLAKILQNMRTKKGPYEMYGTVFGTEAVLHIGHPEVARLVLQSTLKEPAYDHFKGFCGEGVFTADGPAWKSKRASVLHSLFRKTDLAQVAPLANQVMDDLLSALTEGDTVDFVSTIQHQTLSLIYQFLTGNELDQEALKQRTYYLKAVSTIRMVILAFSRSLWMFSRTLYYICSSLGREEQKAMCPIRKFAQHAINNSSSNAPLKKLSQRPSHNTQSVAMLDESITLLFAGQDTSAATLSWTTYLLALNPCWQDQIHTEVTGIAGASGHIDEKIIGKLSIVDAVIKEALRLFPVAPFVARHLKQSVTLPDGTTIPSGITAIIWIYAMHHNPDFWTNANDFYPSRWLYKSIKGNDIKVDQNFEGQNKHMDDIFTAYMPFAHGPRSCIGQPFAHIALRVMLARIFRDWKVELKESSEKKMQVGFTVLPEDGLHVKMYRR
mmetsp:Transcript_6161/g.8019  ORF Transcript_6161/g.8019 Transcript_6161/m.8019 type:complete len:503 (+) Transcript_6161:200-1708(+)